jgi:NADPH:quinone reductase-like Zn-dependent oxidoreductase
MKAAIVREMGQTPVYSDFMEPVAGKGELLISVTAAALTHLTKARAAGVHYTSAGSLPFVVGVDGTGRLEDGRRVYFGLPNAPYGSMAERTVVPESQCVTLPDEIDDVTAAAIANPGMSSWAAYKEVAHLVPGETVLVNGATGTAGRLAVQIAKHLGAKKVIATGRNAEALKSVAALGASATIPLVDDASAQEDAFKEHLAAGVDVVVDYLWGPSAERILSARAKAGNNSVPFRFVQIGAISAPDIRLPSSVLRSTAMQLMGSGLGRIPIDRYISAIDELLKATVKGSLEIATHAVPLAEVEQAWSADSSKSRTVFKIA